VDELGDERAVVQRVGTDFPSCDQAATWHLFLELPKKTTDGAPESGRLGPTPTASSGLYDRPSLEDPGPPPRRGRAGLISSNMSLQRVRAGKLFRRPPKPSGASRRTCF